MSFPINRKSTFLLIFFLTIAVIPSTASSLETLSQEKNNFIFYSGQQSAGSIIIEKRLRQAFKRAGIASSPKFIYLAPAQRALITANENGDGVPDRAANIKQIAPNETENLIQIPESIHIRKIYVYTKSAVSHIDGYKSLENLRNGFRGGIKILEKNIAGEKIMLPDTKRLFQMLDDGRIDTVSVLGRSFADGIIKENNFSGITRLKTPLVINPTYTLIHKKHASLVPLITRALKEMKADGTFELTLK